MLFFPSVDATVARDFVLPCSVRPELPEGLRAQLQCRETHTAKRGRVRVPECVSV